MKHFNIEDFEFSQGYLFYWDKIERCNFFLNNIVKTAKAKEAVNSRLVSFLLYVSQKTPLETWTDFCTVRTQPAMEASGTW